MDEKLAAAVEVVKDNLGAFGRHPYRVVNNTVATDTLTRKLGIEKGEARQLCRVAVEDRLEGYVERDVHTGGLRGGIPPRREVRETWWVHRDKL
jgi:hypothetical protein